ncbi:MAG: sensor histidine kinase [Candidatus Dormibacteraceae bacterium]
MNSEERSGRLALVVFFSRLRWAALILGPALAFGATPPPISVPGILGSTAFVGLYNVLLSFAPRLPSRWLDRLALGSVVADFTAATAWVLFDGNERANNTVIILALIGFEVGTLYLWRGALISGCGSVLSIAALQVEQMMLFHRPFDPFDFAFVAGAILLVPALGAGAASIIRGQRRELAAAIGNLKEREQRLRAILNSTPVGIAHVGPDGAILGCNPTLAAMLGVAETELTGRSLDEFRDRSPEAAPLAYEDLGIAHSSAIEQRFLRGDGRSFWAHLTASPVGSPIGKPGAYVVVVEDITAERNAELAKESATAELARVSNLKSKFMSVVSHEFRNGLVGIVGYAELMQGTDVPPEEVREFAGDIFNDGTRLNRLITDMLDLDKMEEGRMPIHLDDVELNSVVHDAVDRAAATSPEHSFKLELDSRLATLPADRDRVAQVMANLLSNAVKYSPAGGEIAITTRWHEKSAHVSVRDQGVGIPADSLQKVFERYSRLENEATRNVGGTGLGLPIVKEIVELHGGRVWATSEPGHGATFEFTLPLSRAGVVGAG